MPILKPEIQAALRAAGISKSPNGSLEESLDSSGLTLDSSLSTISQIQEFGGSETSRLRAAELALRARGFLKDQSPTAPSITIVINDPGRQENKINPILIPREIELV